MSCYCCFDRLTVELLHTLFDYFSVHEIFYTFSDVSDYVNEVLRSYSVCRLDFKSIRRSDFDLLCHRIHPNEIISLTLSDDATTPGQSELFLSHFQIEEFIGLQSLTLIQTEIDSLKSIFSNLHKLDQLRSLSIHAESISHIHNQFINSHLRHLKLGKCSNDELEMILQHLPQLKSLDVCLNVNRSKFELNLPFNQFIRLSLKIENYRISIAEMEQFLMALPYLKHFELKTDGSRDLFDGYRWQKLTSSFITFNFEFNAQHVLVENILKSFRTSFWLEEKHWFVAYLDYSAFSIPHFTLNEIDISQQSRIRSTAPNNTFLYNYVNKIIMTTAAIKHNHYFTRIKTLELKCSVSLKTIASIMDLSQVKWLTILSLDDMFKFIPLQDSMPQLRELTIENDLTIDLIERIIRYRFEHIYKLEISISGNHIDYIIKKLSILFPHMRHLIYKSPIQSIDIIISAIDTFQYLTNASFYTDIWFYRKESTFCRNPYSITQYSRRLTKYNFTCRVDGLRMVDLVNNHLWIHFWIGEQPSTYLQSMHWLPSRAYCWYRLKYSLSRHLLPYIKSGFFFLKKVLIRLLFMIISLFIIFFFRFFCYIRKYNIYVMFVSIVLLSLAFTYTIVLFPFIIKFCIDNVIK